MTTRVATLDSTDPAADDAVISASRRPLAIVIVYAAAIVLTLLPLFLVETPPLVDLPSHLARLHILADGGNDAVLAGIYQSNWTILPNLAVEAVVLPLAKLMSLEAASRIFVGLTMLLLIGGVAALHRAMHGYWSAWPALAALFTYNLSMFWGFVGFLFTAGLALCAFAGWIAAERWNPWKRAAIFTLAATILFFGHLVALGVYGLCVLAYEFGRSRGIGTPEAVPLEPAPLARFWAPTLAQFAVPFALWLMAPTGHADAPIVYGTIVDKLAALLSPVIFYGSVIDRVLFLAVAVLIVRGLFSRRLKVAPALKYPLLALCAVAVLMPSKLLGTWGADLRLPVVIACIFVGATTLHMKNLRLAVALIAVVGALFAIRAGVVADMWRGYDRQIADFRKTLKVLPKGASLLLAETEWRELETRTYWHVASYAVIDRSAFVPTLFTDPTQQPIRLAPRYARDDPGLVPPMPMDLLVETMDPEKAKHWATVEMRKDVNRIWLNWPARFDYLLLLHGGEQENPVPKHLDRIAGGPFYDLYRIKR